METETKPKKTRKSKALPFDQISHTDFPGHRWVGRNTTTSKRETLSCHNVLGRPMFYVKGVPYRHLENALEDFKLICKIMGVNLLTKEAYN